MNTKILSRNTLLKSRTPVKRVTRPTLRQRLRRLWGCVLVFFGLRRWARVVYPRPKYQRCPFCQRNMRRGAVTPTGAYYYCHRDRRRFHLEGGGRKLVPA